VQDACGRLQEAKSDRQLQRSQLNLRHSRWCHRNFCGPPWLGKRQCGKPDQHQQAFEPRDAEADPATAVTPTAPPRKLHEFSTPEPLPVWVGASAARPRPRGARCRPQRRGRTSAPRSLRASGKPRQWRGRARARPRPTAAYETTGSTLSRHCRSRPCKPSVSTNPGYRPTLWGHPSVRMPPRLVKSGG
jgi:hypothetical protein